MQYVPNLSELCGEDARRDAVHIAVAPVVAGEDLLPGERVFIDSNGVAYLGVDSIGIVDPFLMNRRVKLGEKFWLFLYPNTVTSLRHVWTHPAFKTKVPEAKDV